MKNFTDHILILLVEVTCSYRVPFIIKKCKLHASSGNYWDVKVYFYSNHTYANILYKMIIRYCHTKLIKDCIQ